MFKEKKKEFTTQNGESIVGASVKLEGEFISDENISIYGEVSGKVSTAGDIVIGESAKMVADIEAANVTISGEVKGNVKTQDKLEITATGKIVGNISAKRLVIAEGAYFSGQCDMGEKKEEAQEVEQEKEEEEEEK